VAGRQAGWRAEGWHIDRLAGWRPVDGKDR
jgi:hypothetical protein